MSKVSLIFIVILLVLFVDLLGRRILKSTRNHRYIKPAGLISLLILSLIAGPRMLKNKKASLFRVFWSLAGGSALVILSTALLEVLQNQAEPFSKLILIIAPTIALPFYHFVFAGFGHNAINILASVRLFHLRGILALLFGANLMFVYLEPRVSLAGTLAHAALAFLALVKLFYLCSSERQKISPNHLTTTEDFDCGPANFLHYFVSCTEVSFYFISFFMVFLQPHLRSPSTGVSDFEYALIVLVTIIFFCGIVVKLFFYNRAPWTLKLFEARLLPLSFLIFGVISILQFNL